MPVKTSPQINYLKQNETLPGGTSALFLSSNILKLQASSKLEEEKDYGIKGFVTNSTLIKSRTNEAGRDFQMVYSQSNGYDNILTNFRELKSEGLLGGNGRAYYLKDLPDIKFTQKNFKEKYLSNEELKEVADNLIISLYNEFIPSSDIFQDVNQDEIESILYDEENNNNVIEFIECIDEEQDIWSASDGNYYIKSTGEKVVVEFDE